MEIIDYNLLFKLEFLLKNFFNLGICFFLVVKEL